MKSWAELAGKAVLVTGGSAGLGRGVVAALRAEGARVAIVGRDLKAAEAAAEAVGGEAIALQGDVSVPEDAARVVAQAGARLGPLDGLVNNAAWFTVSPLIETTPEAAARMFATNAIAPLLVGRAFAVEIVARGGEGAIVNISSIAGARPSLGLGLYSASKAALDMLTRTMAAEWTPLGVRVNGVAPGHIETEGVARDFASGRLDRATMTAAIPARRIAEPADVAEAVLFLLSPRARHVTGATLTVDGGEGM